MSEEREKTDSEIAQSFYPHMTDDYKAATAAPLGSSMRGQGHEPLTIERFDEMGEKERIGFGRAESVKIRDIQVFLLDHWRSAASRGRLYDSYVHYTEQLYKAGGIDETAYKALTKFAPELKKATHHLEQKKLLEDVIIPYIGRMGMKEV